MDFSEAFALFKSTIKTVIELKSIINSLSEVNLEATAKQLSNSTYVKNKENHKTVINCIIYASKNRPKNLFLYISLLRLLGTFFDYQDYIDSKLLQMHHTMQLSLFEDGKIGKKDILQFCKRDDDNCCFFFHIYQNESPENYPFISERTRNFIQNIKSIDKHIKYCKEGHCEVNIARLIRDDNVEEFTSYCVKQNIGFNTKIPHSIYEQYSMINSHFDMPTLLEYSAYFCSIKVFKFLWLQITEYPNTLPTFAVAGGDPEIINIIESKKKKDFDSLCVKIAIEYDRPEIIEYLHNQQGIEYTPFNIVTAIEYNNWTAFNLILNDNPNFLIFRIPPAMNTFLHIAASSGILELVKFFCSLKDSNVAVTDKFGISFSYFIRLLFIQHQMLKLRSISYFQ
ncbi:hypothetical protein TRFO_05523 [Tritrichomonas foetus]|uniref:DUF3447 domain-containing protein n=1 Tax=Tritrichomonas foetus TaxID=1144522 RepID=A0A1J4K9N6_9EUKA|nr:hypothetical protein TRFO_05523 [Tritrichomonas foetus]|eukprot:OHT06350.1 hypothetical protein TRFO_05523 [Tritrichomonas foetus]